MDNMDFNNFGLFDFTKEELRFFRNLLIGQYTNEQGIFLPKEYLIILSKKIPEKSRVETESKLLLYLYLSSTTEEEKESILRLIAYYFNLTEEHKYIISDSLSSSKGNTLEAALSCIRNSKDEELIRKVKKRFDENNFNYSGGWFTIAVNGLLK